MTEDEKRAWNRALKNVQDRISVLKDIEESKDYDDIASDQIYKSLDELHWWITDQMISTEEGARLFNEKFFVKNSLVKNDEPV